MPCASSCNAAVTTSSTERLCPRWTTSAPMPCRMRRMMLIAASCPSNSDAAVTKRTLFVGRYSANALYSADRSVISYHLQVLQRRVARRIAQLQRLEHLLHRGRDHQVAMRLRIRRHDGPRGPRRPGRGHGTVVRLLIIVPLPARVEVAGRE